jgi:phage shock protein PspC (stress-responsive transcriptional regulator)
MISMAKKGAKKVSKKDAVLEKRMKDFGEEVETIAEKFGKRVEQRGGEWDSWFHRTFGIVGPLLSSIFGILIFALFTWVIALVNAQIGSGLLADIQAFMATNIGLFFLLFIFFSYASYFSKVSPKSYRAFSPIVIAVSVVIALWLAASVLGIINMYLGVPGLGTAAYVMNQIMLPLFWVFLFIGYLVLAIMLVTGKCCRGGMVVAKPTKPVQSYKPGEVRRLYRSGNDKILGGVCGGIAEYLGVDPVLIRILWVLGTLAWGFGILLYIIFWIIMPRNPNHKWQ